MFFQCPELILWHSPSLSFRNHEQWTLFDSSMTFTRIMTEFLSPASRETETPSSLTEADVSGPFGAIFQRVSSQLVMR
jgi:hypothetical protein